MDGAGGADAVAGGAFDIIDQLIVPRAVGADFPVGLNKLGHVVAHFVLSKIARIREGEAGVHIQLAVTIEGNFRLGVDIQGLPHHGGGVAGGVGDGIDLAVVLLVALHPVGQIPVIVIGGSVALLLIAGEPAGLVALHIFQLQHGGDVIHHLHTALRAVIPKQVADGVFDGILPQAGIVQVAAHIHAQVLPALAEELARGDGINPRLLIGFKALQLHLLRSRHIKAHMPAVQNQGSQAHSGTIDQQDHQHHQSSFDRYSLFRLIR